MSARLEIKRGISGGYSVRYLCPHCGERLRSSLHDAGKQDDCPTCLKRFIVPGLDELERISAAQKAAQERTAHAREQYEKAKHEEKLRREAERTKARQEAERERVERERLAEENRLAQAQSRASAEQKSPTAAAKKMRLPRRSGGVAASILILLVIYLVARGSDLRSKLERCESHGVVIVRVCYSGVFGGDTVVFDLRDGGSAGARRIDPVHLLMQFSDKLDLYSIRRLVLARNGRHRFYIIASDLRTLADSYAGGGRMWAFNNLPSKVRRMDGTHAFEEWSGGWLGVLQKQVEDLNKFITDWTGYGSVGGYSTSATYSNPTFSSESALRSHVRQTLQDMEDNVPETLQEMEDSLPDVMADMEARMMEDAAKYGLSPSDVRAQLREIEAGAREQIRGMEDEVRDQIRGMEDEVVDSLRDGSW
jgi:Zn-finger nucleic acid-binding protein